MIFIFLFFWDKAPLSSRKPRHNSNLLKDLIILYVVNAADVMLLIIGGIFYAFRFVFWFSWGTPTLQAVKT